MRESQKCDSLRVAYEAKEQLIQDLIMNNLDLYKQFSFERDLKKSALEDYREAKKEIDLIDRKRFGVGLHFGTTFDKEWKPVPVISIGLNINIFSFSL